MTLKILKTFIFTFVIIHSALTAAWAQNQPPANQPQPQSKPEPRDPLEEFIEEFLENAEKFGREQEDLFDKFFDEDFDAQMNAMQKKLDKFFKQSPLGNTINPYSKNGKGITTQEIYQEVVDDKLLIHIRLAGLDRKKLDVKIHQEMISIKGEVSHQEKSDHHQQYFSSQFQQSFPLPEGVDINKITYDEKEDEIVIIVPLPKENSKPKNLIPNKPIPRKVPPANSNQQDSEMI